MADMGAWCHIRQRRGQDRTAHVGSVAVRGTLCPSGTERRPTSSVGRRRGSRWATIRFVSFPTSATGVSMPAASHIAPGTGAPGDVIVVRELRKRFGNVQAVDGVDFVVHKGEIFGLLGPNGAGKTTTIEMLEGLQRADGGQLRVLGPGPRSPGAPAQGAHRRAAPDGVALPAADGGRDPGPLRHASTRGPAGEAADRTRWTWREDATRGPRRSRAASSSVCRSRWRWSTTRSWSSSTSRRPASTRPPGAPCGTSSRGMRQQGKTVLLTTHYMEEAEVLCDRLAIMDHGKLAGDGHGRPSSSAAASRSAPSASTRSTGLTDAQLSGLPAVTRVVREGRESVLYTARRARRPSAHC